MKIRGSRAVLTSLGAGAAAVVLASVAARAQQPVQARSAAQSQPVSLDVCADTLRDTATGDCLSASSVPGIGKLVPMSQDFNINPVNGFVGIGITSPTRRLDVRGTIAASGRALMRPSTSNRFGVLETWFVDGFDNTATNLISTVSIDEKAGALATIKNGTTFLVTLSTPANNTSAGYVSVRNANTEVAGINGGTGVVFGSSKSFVQPHPLDASKEIQYVSLEGPEHGVYFRGTATLSGGRAVLTTPESFRLVTRAKGLTVSLTPLGPSRGLYVARKGLDAIEVRENEGGAGTVAFDFLVMGERSALPAHVAIRDNVHFAPQPGALVDEGELPGHYRELMIRNGTLNADGSVNEVNAAGRGWRREQGAWSGGRLESAPVARD